MSDDDSEPKIRHQFGLGVSDIGVIVFALMFFLGTLYLFIGPSPFAPLLQKWSQPPASTGEVSVGLPEAKPLPQQTEPAPQQP